MPVTNKNDVLTLDVKPELLDLINRSKKVFKNNFNSDAWFGRCIFLSWYCSKGTCDFCFRSTQKHKIKFSESARRTKESIYAEAFICKAMHWKLEFLTGGYGTYSFEEILGFAKNCSIIFKEKIWINLGILTEQELIMLKPYVEGIVSSLETSNVELHKKICPDKNFEEYINLLEISNKIGLKTSITIVLGLGESINDYNSLKKIIVDNKLSRITFYALRPVIGTKYDKGPDSEYVAEWVARTRLDFPSIEMVVGSAQTRLLEIPLFLDAGANAFTKIPATKIFGSEKARFLVDIIKKSDRKFVSEFLEFKDIDWVKMVNESGIDVSDSLKLKIIDKLKDYEKNRLSGLQD